MSNKAYCFIHIDKLKGAELNERYAHNARLVEVENADPEKAYLNEELIKENEGKSYRKTFQDEIRNLKMNNLQDRTIRKDAVEGFEIMLTFSNKKEIRFDKKTKEFVMNKDFNINEISVDLEEWKKENVKWLKEHFNKVIIDKDNNIIEHENVKSAYYHGDEGTPHIHAFVIPIDENGRLNGYNFLNDKQSFIDLQDSYAKAMERFGLERGERGSVATQKKMSRFYEAINEAEKTKLPEIEKGEDVKHYKKRAEKEFKIAKHQWYNKNLKLERERDLARTESKNIKAMYHEEKRQMLPLVKKVKKIIEKDKDKDEIEKDLTYSKSVNIIDYARQKQLEEEGLKEVEKRDKELSDSIRSALLQSMRIAYINELKKKYEKDRKKSEKIEKDKSEIMKYSKEDIIDNKYEKELNKEIYEERRKEIEREYERQEEIRRENEKKGIIYQNTQKDKEYNDFIKDR